jgi:hypothetical protein
VYSPSSRTYFQSRAKGTSPSLKNITSGDIKELPIPIPYPTDWARSLAVQRQIVARIEALLAEARELRRLHQEMSADAGRLLDSALREVFGEKDGGWEQVAIGDLGTIIGGSTPSKSMPEYWGGVYPWVSPKDMKVPVIEDSQDHITASALNAGFKLIPASAVLIVFRSGILAHTLPIALASRDMAINQDMKAIVVCDRFAPEYVAHAIKAREKHLLKSCVKKGPTVHSIVGRPFWQERIRVPVGPDSLKKQRQIVDYLNSVTAECMELRRLLAESEKELAALTNSILAHAFRGEL